jgi:hypothetical protein
VFVARVAAWPTSDTVPIQPPRELESVLRAERIARGNAATPGAKARTPVSELAPVSMYGERRDAKALRMPRDHVERGISDRAGRAQQCRRARHGIANASWRTFADL